MKEEKRSSSEGRSSEERGAAAESGSVNMNIDMSSERVRRWKEEGTGSAFGFGLSIGLMIFESEEGNAVSEILWLDVLWGDFLRVNVCLRRGGDNEWRLEMKLSLSLYQIGGTRLLTFYKNAIEF